MLMQIALGALVLALSTVATGFSSLPMMRFFNARRAWLSGEPHDLKLVFAMIVASVWVLLIITISVTIWAAAFRLLGLFATFEEAVYFSLTVFTTLGFGDVLLPVGWRVFGLCAAVNGLLNVGILTAIMIETLRNIRFHQMRGERSQP